MLKSLRTAENAMLLHQAKIETLANNLANVNSTAFKQVLTRVSEAGVPEADAGDAAGAPPARPAQSPGRVGPQRSGEPQLRAALDARPGPLRQTGNATDVALMGDGFFAVQTESGEYYTRDGGFRIDSNRRLVTADGHAVLGTAGPLEIGGAQFSIERDGSVVVDGNAVGRLRIVRFSDPSRLQHAGHGLLAKPLDLEAEDAPQGEVQVMQGELEGSNVSPIDTLINMIAAQRAFEIATQVIQNNDRTLEQSVNKLGQTR